MPLSGVRVLDLSRLLPGPYATRVLAEMGAEVIKVEDPRGGDYARWFAPVIGDPPASGFFRELNRGKKSIQLDLKRPEAQEVIRHIAARSDVLVDSFRPGVLARLGLDPQDLMKGNPKLIYCALTGFGQTGPDAQRAGHDIGYLARAGALGLSGTAEQPVVPGIQVADIGAGMAAVAGISAALFERSKTGRGRVVDIALTEVGMAYGALAFGQLHAGEPWQRGSALLDGSKPCYGIYETQDGKHLAVGALEPKFWGAFLSAIGLPELQPNLLDEGEAGAAVRARVQAKLKEKTRDEWVQVFRSVEACVEPILDMDEVEEDPQFVARKMNAQGFVRSPVRVTDWSALQSEGRALKEAPALGADTREVMEALQVPEGLIAKLCDDV